jgi:DMSO reductase anchor subunit
MQLAVALTHFQRFGRPEHRTHFAARVALLVLGAALIVAVPEWAVLSCVVLLFASELVGRHLFYASHRRVGL